MCCASVGSNPGPGFTGDRTNCTAHRKKRTAASHQVSCMLFLINMQLTLWEAAVLFFLWAVQFVLTGLYRGQDELHGPQEKKDRRLPPGQLHVDQEQRADQGLAQGHEDFQLLLVVKR